MERKLRFLGVFMSVSVGVLASAVLLPACKRQTEPTEAKAVPEPASESAPAPAPDPKAKWLAACQIKMTAPEVHEWKTFWDPAHLRPSGENPSGVASYHWKNAIERKAADDSHVVAAFEVGCSSDQKAKPSVGIAIVTYESKPTDVPLAPGTYPIAAKASPAKNKPGEFIVGSLFFGDSMFAAKSGSLKLDRFDAEGAKGSFTIDGKEILTGSRPVHIEGTFDMPCRKELLQSACKSNKAEQP